MRRRDSKDGGKQKPEERRGGRTKIYNRGADGGEGGERRGRRKREAREKTSRPMRAFGAAAMHASRVVVAPMRFGAGR